MAGLLEPSQLIEVMEENRRLTVRTIQAFPEQELFHYSPVKPMRPFAEMVKEIMRMEDSFVRGIATGEWVYRPEAFKGLTTARELLEALDSVRRQTREWGPVLTVDRLGIVEKDPLIGATTSHYSRLHGMLENEIHHRGQGYVYLRMLGIEPPFFWER